MEKKMLVCQSCGMPLKEKTYGTNTDFSANTDFCVFCFNEGKFTSPDLTLDEQINKLTKMAVQKFSADENDARQQAKTILPSLKRWQ